MKTLISIFTLLMCFSCTREITISGRVYNKATGQGEAGFPIEITQNLKKDGKGGTVYNINTDDNGYYSFQMKQKKYKPYKIKFLTTNIEEGKYYIGHHERILGNREKNMEIDLPFLRTKRSILSTDKNMSPFDVRFSHALAPEYYNNSLAELLSCRTDYSYYYYYSLDCLSNNATFYLLEGWNYIESRSPEGFDPSTNFKDSIYVDINDPSEIEWNIND